METIATGKNRPLPLEESTRADKPGGPFPYTIPLSSNLNTTSALCPIETTLAQIEPHGAVTLFRFTSGEHVERFELSAAEVDALIATNRRRRSLISRLLAANQNLAERFPLEPQPL